MVFIKRSVEETRVPRRQNLARSVPLCEHILHHVHDECYDEVHEFGGPSCIPSVGTVRTAVPEEVDGCDIVRHERHHHKPRQDEPEQHRAHRHTLDLELIAAVLHNIHAFGRPEMPFSVLFHNQALPPGAFVPRELPLKKPMKLEQLGSEYNAVTNERREESSPAVRENEIQHGHGGEHQVDDARELDSVFWALDEICVPAGHLIEKAPFHYRQGQWAHNAGDYGWVLLVRENHIVEEDEQDEDHHTGEEEVGFEELDHNILSFACARLLILD
mmetsp:Transcript_37159/g.100418  ORF Transcript_37159/g.100418 Transcript_37159/m.100418 type:complete len:273 (-) Transcript_37159:771-1589(-)